MVAVEVQNVPTRSVVGSGAPQSSQAKYHGAVCLGQSQLHDEIVSPRWRRSIGAALYLACSLFTACTPAISSVAASPPEPLRSAGTWESSSRADHKPAAKLEESANPIGDP